MMTGVRRRVRRVLEGATVGVRVQESAGGRKNGGGVEMWRITTTDLWPNRHSIAKVIRPRVVVLRPNAPLTTRSVDLREQE